MCALCGAPDKAFSLSRTGRIRWHNEEIGFLQQGDSALRPNIGLLRNDFLDAKARDRVHARLSRWFDSHLRQRLGPLFATDDAPMGAAARGIVFQLSENLGSIRSADARSQIAALDGDDKKNLTRLGLRFGVHALYFAPLLRPAALRLRAVLAAEGSHLM